MHLRAHRGDDFHQRVAVLAAEYFKKRRSLRVRGLHVNDWLNFTIAFMHRAGPAYDAGEVQAGEIDLAEVALGDVHTDHAFAVIVRRKLIEVAGAAGIAIAVLEPRTF